MKARVSFNKDQVHFFHHFVFKAAGCGLSAAVLCAGCATRNDLGLSATEPPGPWGSIEVGAIGVVIPEQPGKFSFDQAAGRIDSTGEGAGAAARGVLLTPNLGDPAVETPAGAVGFVIAPFAAGYGAISASFRKLTPSQLSASEADLISAFERVAKQDRLRKWFLEEAAYRSRLELLPLDSKSKPATELDRMTAIIETRVEQLNLERVKGDYCVLKVKARARTVRTSDGAILCDRTFDFQSGKALFIDWARKGGLESVADTGYRVLAQQMVTETLGPALRRPVFLGGGYEQPKSKKSPTLAPQVNALGALARGTIGFTPCELKTGSQMDVYSGGKASTFLLSSPMTRNEAVSEAQEKTEWALDGLPDCRNSVVQIGACVAAIPVGLWNQAAASVQGLTRRSLASSEATLNAAVEATRPSEAIALEVTRSLSAQTSLDVAYVPMPDMGDGLVGENLRSIGTGPLLASRENSLSSKSADSRQRPRTIPVSLSPQTVGDTVFRIEVSYAGLPARDGINPRLPLVVEAEAVLFRKSDGQWLYSCPIKYCSTARTYSTWAADNARLFREESARCCVEIANALTKDLLAQGVVSPSPKHLPLLVNQ
jgi:hypothetical protein